jgi:hypothetical protein
VRRAGPGVAGSAPEYREPEWPKASAAVSRTPGDFSRLDQFIFQRAQPGSTSRKPLESFQTMRGIATFQDRRCFTPGTRLVVSVL